jgi:hypothetical protein
MGKKFVFWEKKKAPGGGLRRTEYVDVRLDDYYYLDGRCGSGDVRHGRQSAIS